MIINKTFNKKFELIFFLRVIKLKKFLLLIVLLLSFSFTSAYELEFYHSDHLGSPVVVTDESAEVIWSSDYDVFGQTVNEEGNGDLGYNQKEEDETGLHYYGARYYNAELGRFITADTVKGELVDSQSQNLYVYVQNNPMKFIDPTGHKLKSFSSGKLFADFMNEALGGIDAFSFNSETNLIVDNNFDISSESDSVKELYGVFKSAVESGRTTNILFGPNSQFEYYNDGGDNNIFIDRTNLFDYYGVKGKKITFPTASTLAHEIGHFFDKISPDAVGSETTAVRIENLARTNMGVDKRVYYSINSLEIVKGRSLESSGLTSRSRREIIDFLILPEEFDKGKRVFKRYVKTNPDTGESVFRKATVFRKLTRKW